MKHLMVSAAFAALVTSGMGAIAQAQQSDQQSSQSMSQSGDTTDSKSQNMKDCMARQKATNSGLTHLQMQTTCKNEMRANKTTKDGNDLATGPQAGDKQPQQ